MKNLTIRQKKVSAAVVVMTLLFGFFQNCSNSGFSTKLPTNVVNAYCGVDSGCVRATRVVVTPPAQQTAVVPVIAPTPVVVPRLVAAPVVQPPPRPVAVAPLPAANPASALYNFVAGSKFDCEASIQGRLGKSLSCSIGGGCGLSCGMPSASCASANPSLYGACVDPQAPVVSPQPVVVDACKPAGTVVYAVQNCQGGQIPRVDVQNDTQAWTGCCSGSIARTCAVTGASSANPITCL